MAQSGPFEMCVSNHRASGLPWISPFNQEIAITVLDQKFHRNNPASCERKNFVSDTYSAVPI
ncbi:hypothetical protein, partial [Heyndrickxia sporothermodurans]